MSSSDDLREAFAGQVRVLQIIVAAITLGPLGFLGVVLSTAPGPAEAHVAGVPLTYLAYGFAASAVAAWLVVPPLVARRSRRQIAAGTWPSLGAVESPRAVPLSDAGKLCAVYTVRTIIAVAILEGAAFFLVVAYQQERQPLVLGVAAVLMLLIASHLPTRGRVAEWIERQLERLDDDRQLAQLRG